MKKAESGRTSSPRSKTASFYKVAVVVLACVGLLIGCLLRSQSETRAERVSSGILQGGSGAAESRASEISEVTSDGKSALRVDEEHPVEVGKAAPGVRPATEFYPRASTEWQGMLVNKTYRAYCEGTADCGLAMACKTDKLCGPCTVDGDCLVGESCVLDHCVKSAAVSCRRASDCKPDELCVLSGYSATNRANDSMTAFCQPNTGGVDTELTEIQPASKPEAPPVDPSAMLRNLKESQ